MIAAFSSFSKFQKKFGDATEDVRDDLADFYVDFVDWYQGLEFYQQVLLPIIVMAIVFFMLRSRRSVENRDSSGVKGSTLIFVGAIIAGFVQAINWIVGSVNTGSSLLG